jgi:hypothetical protein
MSRGLKDPLPSMSRAFVSFYTTRLCKFQLWWLLIVEWARWQRWAKIPEVYSVRFYEPAGYRGRAGKTPDG